MPREDRPVLVYAEDDYTWNQLAGYVEELLHTYDRRVVYVTSDANDPRLTDHDPEMPVYYIKDTLLKFLPKVDSPVFVTTMPDLDSFHVKRPQTSTCVYAFHSLNSTHASYRTGAFDAYDVFLCVGPYQKAELAARFEAIGKKDYDLRDVGYYKLDRIAAAFGSYEKVHPEATTVLIAPSWGKENLLASVGPELIESIANAGYRTVIRPHPAFFESIYPEGRQIVADLEHRFGDRPNVVFETSIVSEDSFYEADLMVSDWSGAAFEYALGTERPVLFVDVPRKVMNERWEDIEMAPFEERIRTEVGTVLPTDDAGEAAAAVAALLEDPSAFRDRISAVRDREIFNFGRAAHAGAAVIDELVG
jgi:YidC/Oxa1 family membrane protein insertase